MHAFVVYFFAAFSLFSVVDAFANLDAFQQTSRNQGLGFMLAHMAEHYLYQSSSLLELIGPTMATTAVMTVLALLVRHRELSAILAAGVPTYRLAVPFVVGVALVNGALIANQELIVPRIAHRLQGSHEDTRREAVAIEPQYDANWVYVSGSELLPGKRRIRSPEFRLPAQFSSELTTIKADRATYYPNGTQRPAGWLLEGALPAFSELHLTEAGRNAIGNNGQRLFIASDLSAEQLLQGSTGYRYLSTWSLLERLRQPAGSIRTARAMIMNLHARLTRPLLSLIGVFLVIPLVVRREHDGLVGNLALCMTVVSSVFGLWLGCQFLGQTPLVRPETAAWFPLIFGGGLAAWLSSGVRT